VRWDLAHDVPGAVERARHAAELASEGTPRERGAALALVATALLSDGDIAGAEKAAREGLAADPAGDAPLLALVDSLSAGGRRRDVATEIAAAEKRATPSAAWLQRIARWEVTRGFDESGRKHALRALESLEAATGPDAQARGAVAEMLLAAGDPARAEQELRSAVELRPDDEDLAFALADALSALGRQDEARAVLPPVEGADEYRLQRLAGWEASHRLATQALSHAKQARDRVPDSAHPAKLARFDALVGAAQLATGDATAGASWLQAALAHDALQPAERYRTLASALEKASRPADALEVVRRGAKAWPGDVALEIQSARLLMKTGDEAGAVAALDAVAVPSALPSVHAQAALVAAEMGAPAAGRRIMDAVLQRFPESATLWLTSGRLRERQGDLVKAEADMRRALELDPASASTLNAVGYFLADHGLALEEASRLVRKAVDARPEEPAYLDSLGWALQRLGRNDEASRNLEKALARDRDPVMLMHLATTREAQGRGDEALALYREALGAGLDEDLARVESRVKALASNRSTP
jgi:tetratricopeptide (TPR) repeat protein